MFGEGDLGEGDLGVEPPRVYRSVKISKDEPYDEDEFYSEIHS
jgi:hypothetical protein